MSMVELILYQDYARQDVHDIFAPDTPFTPQAGTWGLQGIVAIPHRPGDYVFFVTFGQQQGTHIFDEGITEDGVLSWQSQPKQALTDRHIQQFIHHDELHNTIYLFLRTKKNLPYTYLGPLKYLTHDTEREYPVWFQWQLLDWPLPPGVHQRMGLALQPLTRRATVVQRTMPPGTLHETPPPPSRPRQGKTTAVFRAHKVADYAAHDAYNRALGLAGELLVLQHEQAWLRRYHRPDLAEKVRHISHIEGDGAGYDILSYTLNGAEKYIEVKTTLGGYESAFFITSNEVAFSEQHKGQYYLYRVYNYDQENNRGQFYMSQGSIGAAFTLTPIQYRATLR